MQNFSFHYHFWDFPSYFPQLPERCAGAILQLTGPAAAADSAAMHFPWPYPYTTHQLPPTIAPTYPRPQPPPHMPSMIPHVPTTMPHFPQPTWPPTAHFQAQPPPLPHVPHPPLTFPFPYTLPSPEPMPPSSPSTATPQPTPTPATQPSHQPVPQQSTTTNGNTMGPPPRGLATVFCLPTSCTTWPCPPGQSISACGTLSLYGITFASHCCAHCSTITCLYSALCTRRKRANILSHTPSA